MSSKKRIAALKYTFKAGTRYGIEAQIVGEELERIQKEHNVITPRAVVDAARPDDAPIHPVFEWRDEVAAERYRHWQARTLIKSITVIEQRDGKDVETTVYVHVPAASPQQQEDATAEMAAQGGYQPVRMVVQRTDMYTLALAELSQKFISAKNSLESLKRAAEQAPDTDQERMARIAIAVQAMQTASAAVSALH